MRGYVLRKKDANQDVIVNALRNLGLRVHIWGAEADLIVQYGGITMLCEVRPEGKPREPREGRQQAFHDEFQVYWLQSLDDCEQLNRTLRKWHGAVVQSFGAIPDFVKVEV